MSVSFFRHACISLCALVEYVTEGSGSLNAGFGGKTCELSLRFFQLQPQPVTLVTSKTNSNTQSVVTSLRCILRFDDRIRTSNRRRCVSSDVNQFLFCICFLQ